MTLAPSVGNEHVDSSQTDDAESQHAPINFKVGLRHTWTSRRLDPFVISDDGNQKSMGLARQIRLKMNL